jgi:pimeloyl-ACP methyl ester carboxylesterase
MEQAGPHPRLILLPGLGADGTLFDPQRSAFPQLEVPNWLPHEPGESLPAYALRMAATIKPSEHYYLGGASFGGMVACEMVQHLTPPPRAVLLIASGRSGDCIAPHLRYFVKFARFLPERSFNAAQDLTPLFIQKFGRLTPEQREWFGAMLAAVEAPFIRWGIAAIIDWTGCDLGDMPVHHIHGSDDELIPNARVKADEVIPGGGHLINVTHADQVNAFLAKHVQYSG